MIESFEVVLVRAHLNTGCQGQLAKFLDDLMRFRRFSDVATRTPSLNKFGRNLRHAENILAQHIELELVAHQVKSKLTEAGHAAEGFITKKW